MIKQNLVKIKTLLIDILYKSEDCIDRDAIEYLIDNIDYLLSGKIHLNYEVVDTLITDVLVCGTYNRDSKLLQIASLLNDILGDLPCMK